MKVLNFILIISSLFSYQIDCKSQYSNIVKIGRESDYNNYPHSTHLDTIFHNLRFSYDVEFNDLSQFTLVNAEDSIFHDLIIAELLLKGNNKNGSKAYEHYISAYKNSLKLQDSVLICASTKRLLNYFVFSKRDKQSFEEYLFMHKNYAYDEIEHIYNLYYSLRAQMQYAYLDNSRATINPDIWTEIIEACRSKKYYRLETEIHSIKAVYLEVHERNYEKALESYESAIVTSRKVNTKTHQRIRFTALANIGAMYHSIGNNINAKHYLKKATDLELDSQRPENLIYLFNWLSQVHLELNNQDSAYHFLKRAYDTKSNHDLEKHNIAVSEIQEKYQNESLKVQLINEKLQRSRYYTIAWIFGGLFLMGSTIYFLRLRILILKKLNLEQNVQNLEKQSLLKAVNAKINGEEEERRRVASILHDNIAAHLAASRLHLGIIKKRLGQNDVNIQKTDELITDVSSKVRQLSHELYPPALVQLGLVQALESLCERYTTTDLRFTIDSTSDISEMPRSKQVKLYFVIQELLNNVIKHSKAQTCHVTFQNIANQTVIHVKDDGIGGIRMNTIDSNRFGLYSVRARVEDMGGSFGMTSNSPQGTELTISVPFI